MHTLRNTLMMGLISSGVVLAPLLTMADDTTRNEELVSRHLAAFGANDIEGLLADYSDEAFITTPKGTVRGKAQLRNYYEGIFAQFNEEGVVVNVTHRSCDGNICQIVWNVETLDDSYEFGTDTFLIKDGKIIAQTLAAKARPR